MHRTIGYLSKRVVDIRPGEGKKVLLTFLYFFLIITSYYLIKPVSRSLALGALGSRMIPYIDLVCAAVMGPIVTGFARFVDRVPKTQLVSRTFWLLIGLLVAFWRLLTWHWPLVTSIFYVWVSIFSVLVVTLFWLVANDLYRSREAKRLFGFIGSGGILGGIVGSSIAAFGARWLGTEQLVLLSAGMLLACWFVVQQLWKAAPTRSEDDAQTAARPQSFLSNVGEFVTLLGRSRYLLLLIALVGLGKLISTLLYYQLNPFIEQTFADQDARTAFTGMFFGGMNVLAFLIQFFCTSWILRRWGLTSAMLALPAGLLLGSTALAFVPIFWIAAVTELYDGSLNYSLQQTTKEVLYLPIDRSIRYKVKPFIDMVVFRFGKGMAAIAGIVLLDWLHLPPRILCALIIPALVAWICVAFVLRQDYIARIRTMLQARAVAKRHAVMRQQPVPIGAHEAREPVGPFGALLEHSDAGTKLELIAHVLGKQHELSSTAHALLAELTTYETALANDLEAETPAERLRAIISSRLEPIGRRRQAIRWLAHSADQDIVDYLLGTVLVEEDLLLRQEAVRGLVRLRLRRQPLEFPAQPIRRQIAREVANYQRIAQVVAVYRQHHRGPLPSDDSLLTLLRILLEESVEQVIRLLMLLYRPEDIQLIYEQLRECDSYLRTDAIELLDTLVDPQMRRIIFPILDEDRFLAQAEGPVTGLAESPMTHRYLQEAIWDHNCWLSVATLCAVGRLRLTPMRHEVERAARQAAPVIATAARVALMLVARP